MRGAAISTDDNTRRRPFANAGPGGTSVWAVRIARSRRLFGGASKDGPCCGNGHPPIAPAIGQAGTGFHVGGAVRNVDRAHRICVQGTVSRIVGAVLCTLRGERTRIRCRAGVVSAIAATARRKRVRSAGVAAASRTQLAAGSIPPQGEPCRRIRRAGHRGLRPFATSISDSGRTCGASASCAAGAGRGGSPSAGAPLRPGLVVSTNLRRGRLDAGCRRHAALASAETTRAGTFQTGNPS